MVSGMRFLRCVEPTAITPDPRAPLILRLVVIDAGLVLKLQIGPAVVLDVAILVYHAACGPFTRHPEPCTVGGEVSLALELDADRLLAARLSERLAAFGPVLRMNRPVTGSYSVSSRKHWAVGFISITLERDEKKWIPVFRSSSRSKCKN